MVDVDSTICEVHGYHKQGACYGYTHRLGYHLLLATRADGGEVPHARLRKGSANTARGILRFVDELVARRTGCPAAPRRRQRRADLPHGLGVLVGQAHPAAATRHRVRYSITVRQTKTVRAAIAQIPEPAWVQIAYTPRGSPRSPRSPRQATGDRLIERRIRNAGDRPSRFHLALPRVREQPRRRHHLAGRRSPPSRRVRAGHPRPEGGRRADASTLGPVAANAAWLLAATLAHSLLPWTARLGLGVGDQQTVAKTLRRTLLALPRRLTRSRRQWMLHLPASWPWAHSFTMALARLRCIPYPT